MVRLVSLTLRVNLHVEGSIISRTRTGLCICHSKLCEREEEAGSSMPIIKFATRVLGELALWWIQFGRYLEMLSHRCTRR